MVEKSYQKRMTWFHQARFGMFVHLGPYSVWGRGEWVMLKERIPVQEYAKLADQFKPDRFSAGDISKLAVRTGMKYMIMTTRHHDGFCLWNTQTTKFNSVHGSAKRDFIAEYVAACREAGIRIGFYYSLLDWRYRGYFEPLKYPESKCKLVEQVHFQIRELMSNYGKIDILWYDGGWEFEQKTQHGNPEFWAAKELNEMVRQLQPDILINNRTGLPEDLDTPEQKVVASERGRGWESCLTVADAPGWFEGNAAGWCYLRHNPNVRTVANILQNLVLAASGEGNFLLNVGPSPNGSIAELERHILDEIGDWMRVNGESIYGSQRFRPPEKIHGPEGHLGLWTRKDNVGYLHIFRWPGKEAVVSMIQTPVKKASFLKDGRPVKVRQESYGRIVFCDLPETPPDKYDTVLKVEFESPPQVFKLTDNAEWLGIDGI